MKIRPVGAEFNPDGRMDRMDTQTNMTKLIVAFRNFETAPRNVHHVELLQATIMVRTIVFHWDLQVMVDTFISILSEIHGN